MAGVTSQGFTALTFGELRDSLRARWRSVFGSAVNIDSRSRNGQLIELFADPLSSVWELGETIAAAFDPDGAVGVLLENLAALTGTERRAAFASSVEVICVGTTGTALAAGRRLRVNGTTALFESTALANLAAATAWSSSAFAVGQLVSSDGAVWVCVEALGPSTVAPTGAGPLFEEAGAITWRRLGTGLGFALVPFESVEDGPVQAYAGTLTEIDTPVAGWSGAYNLLDATPGALEETDAQLRIRREQEIAGIGSAPLDAIRARLLRVAGVTSVTVFENTTDVTVDGITPHAVEALVEGGDNDQIRAALFAATAGGIETCGNVSGSVSDSAGNSHTIKFSRPVSVDVYATLLVTKDPASFPVDGEAQIKAAVVAFGDVRGIGRDVVASAIGAQAFRVAGVLDVPTVYVGTAPGPVSSTPIAISVRQRAAYDTSRIVVTLSNGSP